MNIEILYNTATKINVIKSVLYEKYTYVNCCLTF